MGGASSFYAMLAIAGFLTSIWLAGQLSRMLKVSSIVLEVGVGLIMGPGVVGLIPAELSECYDSRTIDCDTRKDHERIAHMGHGTKYCDLQAYLDADMYGGFWGNQSTVIDGHTVMLDGSDGDHRRLAGGGKEGVAMMIFESGMHFDFEQAKTVGPWACAVAIFGTFLPIIVGFVLTYFAFGYDLINGLSAGVALAPTSVGIALKLLHEAKALQTYFGQAVMTAAFVDDVLSLVLFSVLFNLGDDMSFVTFLPLIGGCVFMVLAIVAAVAVWPKVIKFIFDRIEETKPDAKVTKHDEVMWLLMFFTLLAYALITHLCGTHLWGCFIAGMSFATQHHAHHVWVKQVKRITCWFIRVFFACTLAWSIPIDELFSLDAFWKGTIMGIGPCIMTKVFCAPFMGKPRWVIGWAMVGRAEFAYFIAIMANSLKMMEDSLFAILIWALIYATIFAPLVFRAVLGRYMRSEGLVDETAEPTDGFMAISGHLPDLEEEQSQQLDKKKHSDFEAMRKSLEEKEKEMVRITTSRNVENMPNELKQQLMSKDEEIEQLKATLKEIQDST